MILYITCLCRIDVHGRRILGNLLPWGQLIAGLGIERNRESAGYAYIYHGVTATLFLARRLLSSGGMKYATTGDVMSRNLTKAMLCCLAVLVPLASGCSLIGYAIGSSVDNSSPTWNRSERWKVKRLDEGRSVRVTLKDGSVVEGSFRTLVDIPSDQYANAYEATRKTSANGHLLPGIGENVEIVGAHGFNRKGTFMGLGFDRADGDSARPYLASNMLENARHHYFLFQFTDKQMRKMRLDVIKRINRSSGVSLEGSDLRRMVTCGEIPNMTHVAIDIANGLKTVDIDEIEKVAVMKNPDSNAAQTGLIVGLLLDLAAVGAASVAMSEIELFKDPT